MHVVPVTLEFRSHLRLFGRVLQLHRGVMHDQSIFGLHASLNLTNGAMTDKNVRVFYGILHIKKTHFHPSQWDDRREKLRDLLDHCE